MDNTEQTLRQISQHLDISPSDYKKMHHHFNALKEWLIAGAYQSGADADVYLQGSFRLGTVIKPFREDKDGDFDIDLVCELSVPHLPGNPKVLKYDIGNRLKEDANYRERLDEEGRRCWTLEYGAEEHQSGFHIDVLPALPTQHDPSSQIDITDKDKNTEAYSWSVSDPKGYYYWFKVKNVLSDEFVMSQKHEIYQANQNSYQDFSEVPKQLIRSPLQRAIQIMKRHRDVYFAEKENKPISIIITTIAAHTARSDSIGDIISEFSSYLTDRYAQSLEDGCLPYDGIIGYEHDEWLILNPADQESHRAEIENFADKWNEDPELPFNFFNWVKQLERDLIGFNKSGASDDLNLRTKRFGTTKSYSSLLKEAVEDEIEHRNVGNSYDFLRLIHLGVEKKIPWEEVQAIAQLNYDNAENGQAKNVATVNFYQVVRHRGLSLSDQGIRDIKEILENNINSSDFVMCCNILLGTVTYKMMSECMRDHGRTKVASWPIMRLVDQASRTPMRRAS